MKKIGILFFMTFVILSCSNKHYNLQPISQENFEALYQKDSTIQLVDVRTVKEFADGHIEGALLIDVKKDNFLAVAKNKLNKSKPVYVYCKSGHRSLKAGTELLLSKEFNEVFYLTGGYLEWSKSKN